MDDLDECMWIQVMRTDAKDETDGFVQFLIDLFKIPAFEVFGFGGLSL